MARVYPITPQPQFKNNSRATVPLSGHAGLAKRNKKLTPADPGGSEINKSYMINVEKIKYDRRSNFNKISCLRLKINQLTIININQLNLGS